MMVNTFFWHKDIHNIREYSRYPLAGLYSVFWVIQESTTVTNVITENLMQEHHYLCEVTQF